MTTLLKQPLKLALIQLASGTFDLTTTPLAITNKPAI